MPNLNNNDATHWADPHDVDIDGKRHIDTCEGYGPAPDDDEDDPFPETCSMCGSGTHTERERTDDGEWDEDCVYHPFFDGDDNDLRQPGQAGRSISR